MLSDSEYKREQDRERHTLTLTTTTTEHKPLILTHIQTGKKYTLPRVSLTSILIFLTWKLTKATTWHKNVDGDFYHAQFQCTLALV